MTHENPHPPAAPPAPSATGSACEEGSVSVTSFRTPRARDTETIALELVTGNHAQIMDMLGRDPQGAPDEAWDRAAEILLESMHGCVTVLTARRNRADDNRLRPLVTATIRPDETLAQYTARALGMGA